MSTSSPAQLYCTLVGAVLVIAGIIGFFYSASFDTGTSGVLANTDDVFGVLGVNGWHNLVHILHRPAAAGLRGQRAPARPPSASGCSTSCSRSGGSRLRQRAPRARARSTRRTTSCT